MPKMGDNFIEKHSDWMDQNIDTSQKGVVKSYPVEIHPCSYTVGYKYFGCLLSLVKPYTNWIASHWIHHFSSQKLWVCSHCPQHGSCHGATRCAHHLQPDTSPRFRPGTIPLKDILTWYTTRRRRTWVTMPRIITSIHQRRLGSVELNWTQDWFFLSSNFQITGIWTRNQMDCHMLFRNMKWTLKILQN